MVNVDEFRTRLMNLLQGFDQSIIDAAICQWRGRKSACPYKWGTFRVPILTMSSRSVITISSASLYKSHFRFYVQILLLG